MTSLARLVELGPQVVAVKLARRVDRAVRGAAMRWRDRSRSSYEPVETGERLRRRLQRAPGFTPQIDELVAHRFDLLGSGPVDMAHPGSPEAEVNHANRPRAASLRGMITPQYRPIDWQRDAKSGHRWPVDAWHEDIPLDTPPGVDIKLPWELARLQHLPRLALAGPDGIRELRDQALDFLAANPPRFGVNWRGPMDVAIRAANLALAWDLAGASGHRFDAAFDAELAAGLRAHANFLLANLEWQPDYRGNHYLANLVGLLFCAAYLPQSAETRRWLAFAGRELQAETAIQFLADGASHEASTCYHRLAAELTAFGTALLLAEGIEVPAEHGARLAGMAAFIRDLTGPTGEVAQIGDNDSGRLFKLEPRADLDHRDTADAIDALFEPSRGPCSLVAALAQGRRLAGEARPARAPIGRLPEAGAASRRRRFGASAGGGPVRVAWYPNFGVATFRAAWLFLAVRCRGTALRGPAAHAHNDQLSIDLWIDGHPVVRDPGSYLYTSAPDWRDRYRSIRAHDAPWLDGLGEPAPFRGVFGLGHGPLAECLHAGPDGFLGRLLAPAPPIHRAVRIGEGWVEVIDWVDGDPAPRWLEPDRAVTFAPAYGCRGMVSSRMTAGGG